MKAGEQGREVRPGCDWKHRLREEKELRVYKGRSSRLNCSMNCEASHPLRQRTVSIKTADVILEVQN